MTTNPSGLSSGLIEALKTPSNPFPGLRPFQFQDSHLFFGRDEQIEKLTQRLTSTRFLAVVGTSGSGKSSLVRAGLMPALRSGLIPSVGSNWRIAILNPGNDPIGNLARALNEKEVFDPDDAENQAIQIAVAEATLRLGSRGLIETVRQNEMPETESLLVIVDQFEELFRYAREGRKSKDDSFNNDAAAFVKLLLEAVKPNEQGERDANIYIVLTMRSDFLGDCSQFWDLPEAINESQYLVPRLTRDQLREVIEGPVAVGGGQITPRLVNQLLNDIVDNQDQLPILQHALMRTWDEWRNKSSKHQAEHTGEAIDVCCYEAIGGMPGALSKHANEAYDELPEDHREIAKKMFKALTGKGEDNREIRCPVEFRELYEVIGADPEQVKTVIEAFRRPDRSFLMPPAGIALLNGTPIDILHESLIRNWKGHKKHEEVPDEEKRLEEWVKEESESAQRCKRLVDYSQWEFSLEGENLKGMLDWQKGNNPNSAWARRYGIDKEAFDQALGYLAQSEAKDNKRQAQDNRKRYRKRWWWRFKDTLIVFLLATVIGLALAINLILRQPESVPNGPLEQPLIDWWARVISEGLYWGLYDLIAGARFLLERWWSINNPIFKVGILFGAVLGLVKVARLIGEYSKFRKMSLYCPECHKIGFPIRGTQNRYLCSSKERHRFNGDPHGFV